MKYRKVTYSITSVSSVPWDTGTSTELLAMPGSCPTPCRRFSRRKPEDPMAECCSYSQMAPPISAGFMAIGLCSTAASPLVCFIKLQEPMTSPGQWPKPKKGALSGWLLANTNFQVSETIYCFIFWYLPVPLTAKSFYLVLCPERFW